MLKRTRTGSFIRTYPKAHTYRRGVSSRTSYPKREKIYPRGVLAGSALKLYPTKVEKKQIDVQTTTDGTTTSVISLLNPTAQGVGASQRIGRNILMKSIEMKGWFRREDVTTNTVQAVRCSIFYDKQPNGTAPTIAFFFNNTGPSPTWLRNLTNADRFYCLYDEVINLDGTGGQTVVSKEWFKKINLPVQTGDSNNGDITDIFTGALWLVYTGTTAAGTDDIDVNIATRVRFTDS